MPARRNGRRAHQHLHRLFVPGPDELRQRTARPAPGRLRARSGRPGLRRGAAEFADGRGDSRRRPRQESSLHLRRGLQRGILSRRRSRRAHQRVSVRRRRGRGGAGQRANRKSPQRGMEIQHVLPRARQARHAPVQPQRRHVAEHFAAGGPANRRRRSRETARRIARRPPA